MKSEVEEVSHANATRDEGGIETVLHAENMREQYRQVEENIASTLACRLPMGKP
jgi:hypothetical protein